MPTNVESNQRGGTLVADKMYLVSADAHIVEPPELWEQRLDKRFRDRAPKVSKLEYDGVMVDVWHVEHMDPVPVGGFVGASAKGDALREAFRQGFAAAPKSVWDPAERLVEQDLDGVSAEVLYNTWCMMLFHLDDLELRAACFRAYNDHAAEYTSYAPERMFGVGAIDVADIDAAVAELERIAANGLRGASITGFPPLDRPFHSPIYDKFWAAAQDLSMPISLHTGTGVRGFGGFGNGTFANYIMNPFEIQLSVADIIFGGVFDRFPGFKLVLAEADVSWLPHLMYRMDHAYTKFDSARIATLSMRPSEYVTQRGLLATFQFEDRNVGFTVDILGPEHLAWATDYPHIETKFPYSQAAAAGSVADLTADQAELITSANALRYYGRD
jgi:predicted TIM-barrel fold metal-dependent hydrolase